MELEDLLSDELLNWMQGDDAGAEIDGVLTAAIDQYKTHIETQSLHSVPGANRDGSSPQTSTSPKTSSSLIAASSRPFAPVKTDAEIELARTQGIPKKMQDDTRYCVNLWDAWTRYRLETTGHTIKPLSELNHTELQHWLTRFVLEVRKKDGSEFPPRSLHHICCGLMRYLRWNGQPSIDFFCDSDFADFKASLDAEMKRLQSEGTGSKTQQAEVLTEAEEELLWQRGLLGDATPQTLLDTMVFFNGLYFALQSGKEHRQLRTKPCQIEVVEHPGERAYLKYTEDISKNRPGEK